MFFAWSKSLLKLVFEIPYLSGKSFALSPLRAKCVDFDVCGGARLWSCFAWGNACAVAEIGGGGSRLWMVVTAT